MPYIYVCPNSWGCRRALGGGGVRTGLLMVGCLRHWRLWCPPHLLLPVAGNEVVCNVSGCVALGWAPTWIQAWASYLFTKYILSSTCQRPQQARTPHHVHTPSCGCLTSGAQDGVTPLYAACQYKHLEVAKLLLKAGANTELAAPVGMVEDGGGRSPGWEVAVPRALFCKYLRHDRDHL